MRRVRYHEYGGPEVLRVEEADVPEPGPGQLRIRADVIGAHFVDRLKEAHRPLEERSRTGRVLLVP